MTAPDPVPSKPAVQAPKKLYWKQPASEMDDTADDDDPHHRAIARGIYDRGDMDAAEGRAMDKFNRRGG